MIQKYLHQKILNITFLNNNLVPISNNLIDQIFKFKERMTKPFYSLGKSIVGESHHIKNFKGSKIF